MVQIQTERRNGATLKYYEPSNRYEDGSKMRIYLLPGVPTDVVSLPIMPDLKKGDLDDFLQGFHPENRKKARNIIESYSGRQIDAASVLRYADEQGKFPEYAKTLEDKMESDIKYVHPDARYARTDFSAFILGLYADLGIAPREEAESMKKQVESYGAGVVVLLRE
jgi:hypothetical protein